MDIGLSAQPGGEQGIAVARVRLSCQAGEGQYHAENCPVPRCSLWTVYVLHKFYYAHHANGSEGVKKLILGKGSIPKTLGGWSAKLARLGKRIRRAGAST